MKQTVAIVITVTMVATTTVVFALYLREYPQEQAQNLKQFVPGFHIRDIADFTITERFGQYYSDSNEINLVTNKDGNILRVKILSNIEEKDAHRYATGQFILLATQYDTRLPPYPEFLTNKTGCESRFLPVKRATPNGVYYLVHAGARFNYGLCSDDLVKFKAGFGIFYCEAGQKSFQLEYFTPKDSSKKTVEELMDSFTCDT